MRDVTSCEEAVRLLAEFLDGELAEDARDGVDRHLRTCRSCYSRAEFERRLKQQLAELHAVEPGDEFELRMRMLMGSFSGSTNDAGSTGGGRDGRHHD